MEPRRRNVDAKQRKRSLEHILKLIIKPMKVSTNLLKLRTVSKLFNSIISEKLNSERFWKKLCYNREIVPWLAKLKRNLFPSLKEDDVLDLVLVNQYNWKKMYIHYRKWRNISRSLNSSWRDLHNANYGENFFFVASFAGHLAINVDDKFIDVVIFTKGKVKKYRLIKPVVQEDFTVEEIGFWNAKNGGILLYVLLDNGYLYFGKHTMTLWMSNSEAFENILCQLIIFYSTDNDVLISVQDDFTHLKKHIRSLGSPYHPINGDTKEITGLPSNINLNEYTIIGMFGDADNLILASLKEKIVLKMRIKVPKSAQSTYEIYNFTLITLDDSNTRTPFYCYIPHSDVMVIANGTILVVNFDYYQDQNISRLVFIRRLRIENIDDPIISLNIDEVDDRSRIIAGTKSTIKYLNF
ncbi:hypothetical protein KQX54_003204 [Cotesia glomerata]|uniref:F-box domain-containing protein n=1 Tax=Cotesia glomerata TaxID=32391 RepID=A0AAV7I155_COTGL|nr:hypothetical protein KQX54_003204 [Cotesia glomerata]